MAKSCHNYIFLEEVYFKEYKEFQISLILRLQFSEPVAKSIILSNLQSQNFLNYPP